MSRRRLEVVRFCIVIILVAIVISMTLGAQSVGFRSAPASAAQMKNPFAGDIDAAAGGGKKLYAQNCAQCHGNNLQGMGPAPSLLSNSVKTASPGELFWFITNGELNKGMPGWSQLPKQQRWQIVSFLESRNASK